MLDVLGQHLFEESAKKPFNSDDNTGFISSEISFIVTKIYYILNQIRKSNTDKIIVNTKRVPVNAWIR